MWAVTGFKKLTFYQTFKNNTKHKYFHFQESEGCWKNEYECFKVKLYLKFCLHCFQLKFPLKMEMNNSVGIELCLSIENVAEHKT